MHNILPPLQRSTERATLGYRPRPIDFGVRNVPNQRIARTSRVSTQPKTTRVGDIVLPQLAQPHLLHLLTEYDVYIHSEIEVIEPVEVIEPEELYLDRVAVFKRAHRIINQDKMRAKLSDYLVIISHPVVFTKFHLTQ